MGHLAWADAFVITADSVSMLSEACSTGYVPTSKHDDAVIWVKFLTISSLNYASLK